MITAAYTIVKNDVSRIDRWLYYTQNFDYRVILDTGSTDGTYEKFKKVPNIIIDQYTVEQEKWRFDIPRNINLNMIPKHVEWCLSPDCDEWFSINVLDEMEKTIKTNPEVTNISCTRLDIYSKEVFVGPPKHLGSNKIHRRFDYDWKMPIYEHLSYIGGKQELEIFNEKIYLIHDQDISKPRSKLYKQLLIKEYECNPQNCWNSWFLANEYYIEKDLENFVKVGLDFIKFGNRDDSKYLEILTALKNISVANNVDAKIKVHVINTLALCNIF